MIDKFLLAFSVLPFFSLGLEDIVCEETNLRNELYAKKPKYKVDIEARKDPKLNLSPTPRSVLEKLRFCTVYNGNVMILPDVNREFEEYIRPQDLENLSNLRVVNGSVFLYLKDFRNVTDLSFFSSLITISTSDQHGFTLIDSHVQILGLRNVQLNVRNVKIFGNEQLCYLTHFDTINSSIQFNIDKNKNTTQCATERKVCSRSCRPDKGCWGPESRDCFECRWKSADGCVHTCESRWELFTPTPFKDRVCGQCHENCTSGCFGPELIHCRPDRESNDNCPKYMYYHNASGQCKECSRECFGEGYHNRHLLIGRACSGPANWKGRDGCHAGCKGLNISSAGFFTCSPIQVTESKGVRRWIVAILCLSMVAFGFTIGSVIRIGIPNYIKRSKQNQADIFISYEEHSIEVAKEIQRRLVVYGFSCRTKVKTVAVDAEIQNCKVVVVCVTRAYMESLDCIIEFVRANHHLGNSLIPLVLDDTEWPQTVGVLAEIRTNSSFRISTEEVDQWTHQTFVPLLDKLNEFLPGMDLMVLYDDRDFCPVSRFPCVSEDAASENCGKVRGFSHIKCRIRGETKVEMSFDELRSFLEPLFSGRQEIQGILQLRGSVGVKSVVEVTSSVKDMTEEELKDCSYCDQHGNDYSWEQAEDPQQMPIVKEGHVNICGKRRRTVLTILSSKGLSRFSKKSEANREQCPTGSGPKTSIELTQRRNGDE